MPPPGSPLPSSSRAGWGWWDTRRLSRARSSWQPRSGCRAYTCACTTGRTWRAAGGSASGSSGRLPQSRCSSSTCATMTSSARLVRSRAPVDEPRFLLDRDRDRTRRQRGDRLLRRPHPHTGVALLWAALGADRGGLHDALHPGHDARDRGRGRPRRRLDLRHLRLMHASPRHRGGAAEAAAESTSFLEALDEVSEAVESGAGLPAVARAAGRALDASVIVLDAASSVLAVACEASEDERAVMAGERGAERIDLRVAELPVGQLRFRPRSAPPAAALQRLVANLIALEVDRAKAPARATEAAVGDFLED